MSLVGFSRAQRMFWWARDRKGRQPRAAAEALLAVLREHPEGEEVVLAAAEWLRDGRLVVPPEWASRREVRA